MSLFSRKNCTVVKETVSVTAEVSAKGKVSLLGSGGELGGKGGITFTFKRSTSSGTNS